MSTPSESKVDEITIDNTINNVFKIRTLISIGIIIATVIIATIVSNKFNNVSVKKNKKIVMSTIANIVYYVIILIGILISLLNVGFQLGSIIVVLSSMGIALALGVQNILKQFVSGLLITLNEMYNIDDYIITNGTEGTVTKFSLLTTTLTNDDDITITIPNDKIVNSNITNITNKNSIRIRVFFTIKNLPDFNYTQFIELIKKTTLLSKYVINKNIVVDVDTISHMLGTKIVVKAYINSRDYNRARNDIKFLLLKVLSNSKVLNSPVNISIIEKE
jgi:small-conductance mechanosensitive channel